MSSNERRKREARASDPWESPEMQEFLQHYKHNVLPKVKESAVTIALWSGEIDPKQAIELGYMVALDKPIVLLVEKGCHVPEKLARIADVYMEYDGDVGPAMLADQLGPLLKGMKGGSDGDDHG